MNRWPGKATPAEVLIRERFSDTSAETTRLSSATHPSLNLPYPTISFDEENDSPLLMTLDEFRLPSIKGTNQVPSFVTLERNLAPSPLPR